MAICVHQRNHSPIFCLLLPFFIIKADLEPHLHAGLELEAWLRDGDVVVVVAVEEVGGLSEEGVMLCIP